MRKTLIMTAVTWSAVCLVAGLTLADQEGQTALGPAPAAVVSFIAPKSVSPGAEFEVKAVISSVESISLRGYQLSLNIKALDVYVDKTDLHYIFKGGSSVGIVNLEKNTAYAATYDTEGVVIPTVGEDTPPGYLATFLIQAPVDVSEKMVITHGDNPLFRGPNRDNIPVTYARTVVIVEEGADRPGAKKAKERSIPGARK